MTWRPEVFLQEPRKFPQKFFPPAQIQYVLKGCGSPVAVLFGRSEAGDAAAGNPEAHWKALGHDLFREPLVAPLQVHDVAVVPGRRIWALPQRPRADGVELDGEGIWGSLRFADCWPVVLAGPSPQPWVMVLHAGYRGAVACVLERNLRRILERWGPQSLNGLCVWIGPGIGPCCYTRASEDPLVQRGRALFPEAFAPATAGLVAVDIGLMLRRQCHAMGVPREAVCSAPWCTSCVEGLFYSYRRGDREARNFLVTAGPQKELFGDNLCRKRSKSRSEDGA